MLKLSQIYPHSYLSYLARFTLLLQKLLLKVSKAEQRLLNCLEWTWSHLVGLKRQLCCFQTPLSLSLTCNEVTALHSIAPTAVVWLGSGGWLQPTSHWLRLCVLFLSSAKPQSPGHCHRSLRLLCKRHAGTLLTERGRGEDLHENECEWLVERRSKWQGELSYEWIGSSWVQRPTAIGSYHVVDFSSQEPNCIAL